MKAIQKELGDDDQSKEIAELRDKLNKLQLPREARQEVEREIGRLERAGRESMEAQVIRTYLEWIAELPWNNRSDDNLDLSHAQTVLDEYHYGLPDVKDRVLEVLAVRQLRAQQMEAELKQSGEMSIAKLKPSKEDANPQLGQANHEDRPITDAKEAKARAMAKGPILLFVGPPGVGKTSIAKSIARSLGRQYVRVALGGARDEADIRGDRQEVSDSATAGGVGTRRQERHVHRRRCCGGDQQVHARSGRSSARAASRCRCTKGRATHRRWRLEDDRGWKHRRRRSARAA